MSTPWKSFSIIIFCALMGLGSSLQAADQGGSGKRDSSSVLNSLRLKQLTKQLDLTEDQQKKVMVLLEEEAKVTSKYRENNNMEITERSMKIKEAQEVTYAKMKPLLTPPQAEKLEKLRADAAKPKKKK